MLYFSFKKEKNLSSPWRWSGDILTHFWFKPPLWHCRSAFAVHAGERGSIPVWGRPKSFKQYVTSPLSHAWQQIVNKWVHLQNLHTMCILCALMFNVGLFYVLVIDSDDENSHVEAHWEAGVLSASITTADDIIVLEVNLSGFIYNFVLNNLRCQRKFHDNFKLES